MKCNYPNCLSNDSSLMEYIKDRYIPDEMLSMCIAPIRNNYRKMHGKAKIRQVAGRKRKKKYHNQYGKCMRNKARIYYKKKHKLIKMKNRSENEH